jgi:hypothetical protein
VSLGQARAEISTRFRSWLRTTTERIGPVVPLRSGESSTIGTPAACS